jgi:hypothetical protein
MLRKISQTQKDEYHIFCPYVEPRKKDIIEEGRLLRKNKGIRLK